MKISKFEDTGKSWKEIKKVRKPSRKSIRTKLDKLVKEFVKKRDNYTCQHCGKHLEKNDCHGSHVIPVSAGLGWAYDPMNIITMCFHCHINWWHKNPVEAGDWFKETFPDTWKHLEEKRNIYMNRPIKDFQLAELYEGLSKELRNVE